MQVEIRIYRQYDMDIMALTDLNIRIGKLIKETVTAYANGKRVRYILPMATSFNSANHKTMHLMFSTNDPNTIKLLKSIKPRFRNAFCKQLLRDALVCQNLSAYFKTEERVKLEQQRLDEIVDEMKQAGIDVTILEKEKQKEKRRNTQKNKKNSNETKKKEQNVSNEEKEQEISCIPIHVEEEQPIHQQEESGNEIDNNEEESLIDFFAKLAG